MSKHLSYIISGHIELATVRNGFITPVFNCLGSDEYFVQSSNNETTIDSFLILPIDSLSQIIWKNEGKTIRNVGDPCIYGFKWGDSVVFGEAASLSPFFMSNVLSTKIRNTLHASITEFILSHEGQAELILSKKLFGDRQDGGHHPLVIETTKIVSNNNLWSIEPRYSDVGFTTLKKAAYRTISSHGSTEVRQKITIQQNALFATIEYTPGEIIADFAAATISSEPTYLTVQVGTGKHITLMPEYLQYINHSCDPNVFFNTTKMQLIALKEILPDEEMTFFYPASEWKMTQPFNCYCGSKYCIGEIKGAAFLSRSEREKYRFTDFILQQFSKRANFSEKYGAA